MGLLDQVLGGVLGSGLGGGQGGARRGGLGGGRSPIVNAVLMALAAKALQHYLSERRQTQSSAASPGARPTTPSGGSDILGGLFGGAAGGLGGLGGLLGSLGGAGALGGLIDHLGRRGLADQSQSWIGAGGNQPLDPQHLAQALDDNDIEQLASATGMPKAQVLDEVASALPSAIDALTPNGRLPTDDELAELSASFEAQAGAAATPGR